jgi:ribosomal RNA-processing protein 12
VFSGQCLSPAQPFFGLRFELVKGLLPQEYHKVLVNIRKAETRAKKHRALSQAAMEEEEEEEEEPIQGKGDR